LQKSVSLTYHLHLQLINCMVLPALGLFHEFFRAEPTRKCGLEA
jgi:hypothetical protein